MPTSMMDMPTSAENKVMRTKSYLFATFSLVVAVLVIPPLKQHYHNRNIGATVLVAATIYANLQSFLNALLWPDDNTQNWYNGVGLCDVEVKLQVWLDSVFPAAIFCVLKALATVMDTNRTTWGMSQAQKRRGYVVDLVCCLAIPALGMLFHFIVQPLRYFIFGMSGCSVAIDMNPVTVAFIYVPPIIWTVLGVLYSVLIVVRLIRYRRNFNSVLANNQNNKSRFFRLYILCSIQALGYLPIRIYLVYYNFTVNHLDAFSWDRIHNPKDYDWNSSIMVQTKGILTRDRWTWLIGGILVFAFFGFGRDAMKLYRDILLSCGFGKLFPTLRAENRTSVSATMSSMSSKAKMLFSKRKGSIVNSFHSNASTLVSEPSPRKQTFMETIKESPSKQRGLPLHIITNDTPSPQPGLWNRLTSLFTRSPASARSNSQDHFFMTQVGNQQHVQSQAYAEPASPPGEEFERRNSGVIVKKEIRQNSETAVDGAGV